MLVDAVGGLGNALVVQPAQSFNRLLQQGYEPGNPQSAEDAFNVAGAAMASGGAGLRGAKELGFDVVRAGDELAVYNNDAISNVNMLFANGGKQGAAVGAAANAEQQDKRELKTILDKYGLGQLLQPTDWARKMQPGDA
jgi:hypothetical protein